MLQSAGTLQPMDQCLRSKIKELVVDGVTSVKEMERHLNFFVQKELFAGKEKPKHDNRRFFPHSTDIRNQMHRATIERRHSAIDQEDLAMKIQHWKQEAPNDRFFLRATIESRQVCTHECDTGDDIIDGIVAEGQNFLYVHQTKWQQHLIQQYGGEICLLDATYKTTRYALPLFFVCVKTNIDYQVVASFITQYEDASSIKEALTIVTGWNATWTPSYFMTDYSEAEINAVESVFDGKYFTKRTVQQFTI